MNIKPILDSTRIALEKSASDKFGTAVEDFGRGGLGRASAPPPPSGQTPSSRNDGSFYASSYAHALAGATSYRPKLKFLFKVEFIFTEEAKAAFPSIFGGATNNDFTFMVKSVDRPKIDFEYDDDVNMYNFRTKVLKRIRHRELTMSLIDDTGNRVLDFFRAMMMIYSPITRRQLIRQNGATADERTRPPSGASAEQGTGMQFTSANTIDQNDTAMRGAIFTSVGSVIQTIRVKQIFINPQEQLANAVQEVIFDFLNARVVSFDLDDMNHETSEVNTLTMQFDYDWLEVVNVGALTKMDGPDYSIAVPGVGGAPVDMTPMGGGGTGDSPGNGNPFINMNTNRTGGQQITSEAVSRDVKTTAGKGRFASLIGSQASNILGGIVGAGAKNIVTPPANQGLAGANYTNSIRNATTNFTANTRVIDSAEAGSTNVISSVSSDFKDRNV